MNIPSVHQIVDTVTWTSTGLSLVYSVLPTVETFNGYPRFQKVYSLALSIIKQLGANLRNLTYPQINTQHGTQTSEAGATTTLPVASAKQ